MPKRHFILSPSFEEAKEFLQAIIPFKWGDIISIDIEAFRGALPIKCIGFSVSAELAIVIPIFSNKPWYSLDQEVELWKLIKIILQSEKIKKIIQNEQYERLMLFDLDGEIRGVILDNMRGQRLLFPALYLRLSVQASIFTDEPYFKDDASNAGDTSEALWNYNGKDCTVQWEIGTKMIEMLRENNLADLAFNLSMPLSKMMWKASHIGVLIDRDKIEATKLRMESNISKNQSKLDNILGRPLNVQSPQQSGHLTYAMMNIPTNTNTKSGQIT